MELGKGRILEDNPIIGSLSSRTNPLTHNGIFANVILFLPLISTITFTESLYGTHEARHR
jgi:hypothetical protein